MRDTCVQLVKPVMLLRAYITSRTFARIRRSVIEPEEERRASKNVAFFPTGNSGLIKTPEQKPLLFSTRQKIHLVDNAPFAHIGVTSFMDRKRSRSRIS